MKDLGPFIPTYNYHLSGSRIRKLAEITSQIAPVLTLSHLQEECHYFMQVFATQNMIELATVKPLLTTFLLQKKAHVRMIPMYHQVTSFRIHLEPAELEFEPAKTASSIQCLSYQNEKKTFYFGRFRPLHLGVYRICVHKMLPWGDLLASILPYCSTFWDPDLY